jgi:hypothetical protein
VKLRRKENRRSKRVQILGLHIQERATDKAHIRAIVRKANKVVGWKREKVGR